MPKIIELTFELKIEKVSCPGVWLCQDGRVSLTIFTLGKSYQTCLAPPVFPILFRDTFYFRKRFEESCSLSNICCLLKDETIYCELVQWCEDCNMNACTVLAQYLGALNDILFPPNMCSNEGVDLLMRRAKDYPGILSPKIEVKTKVRIDEIWNQPSSLPAPPAVPRVAPCSCGGRRLETEQSRQKQVCHTPLYHRAKGHGPHRLTNESISRSCCSLVSRRDFNLHCDDNPCSRSRTSLHAERCRQYHQYHVYNVRTPPVSTAWRNAANCNASSSDSELEYELACNKQNGYLGNEDKRRSRSREASEPKKEIEAFWTTDAKPLLESRYIDTTKYPTERRLRKFSVVKKVNPCLCEICKRYYELFLSNKPSL